MFVDLYTLASARGECWVDPLAIKYIRRTSEGLAVRLENRTENLRLKQSKVPAAIQRVRAVASAARM